MPSTNFLPISEFIPHSGSMSLLDEVVEHDEDHTSCYVTIASHSLFQQANGNVPSWVGIEYMAQCAAAHVGMVQKAKNEPPMIGFLMGSRKIEFFVEEFFQNQTLQIRADLLLAEKILAAFHCTIFDTNSKVVQMQGNLNFFQPDTITSFQDL